ncbi:hypothetical protein A5669_15740 [Mycolicibacterium fortuitum]|nr:hypothetical protein A5669_15740 [Mycolicibacterium fortuitum]
MVAILETGARVATYKLATLIALIGHCIDPLTVPPDLAHWVLELYWRQVRRSKVTIFGSPPVSASEFLALPGRYVRLRLGRH